MSLRKYHDGTIAINDAALYYPYLESHKNLLSIAILLKISQFDVKICTFRKKTNKNFDQNYPKDPFLRDAAHIYKFLAK